MMSRISFKELENGRDMGTEVYGTDDINIKQEVLAIFDFIMLFWPLL